MKCTHERIRTERYEFRELETGYRDRVRLVICVDCDAEFTPEEFRQELEAIEREALHAAV